MTSLADREVISGFQGEYRFLSNFWEGEPIPCGFVFPTAEHLYQSLKTDDPSEALWVCNAKTPGEAKRRGQKVTVKKNWFPVEREKAMRKAIGQKFLYDAWLRKRLLATGDALLVETNRWHDQYWGDCDCGSEDCSEPGQNLLGKILMELRADLRKWS